MAMNWLYFKPEFSGMPEEDPEAHIFRIIDWMDTRNFASGQKVQRFLLILEGEAKLWYQSIHSFLGN